MNAVALPNALIDYTHLHYPLLSRANTGKLAAMLGSNDTY